MTSSLVWSSIVSIAQACSQPSAPPLEAVAPGPPVPITSVGQWRSLEDPETVRIEDVVVLGRRGSTSLVPEVELGEAEIDALGAYDVGEVIRRIARDLGFEAPIIIVNGRRALNPADFTGFPPDALVRVEALPPEPARSTAPIRVAASSTSSCSAHSGAATSCSRARNQRPADDRR